MDGWIAGQVEALCKQWWRERGGESEEALHIHYTQHSECVLQRAFAQGRCPNHMVTHPLIFTLTLTLTTFTLTLTLTSS